MKVIVGNGHGCTKVLAYSEANIYKIVELHSDDLTVLKACDRRYETICNDLLANKSTYAWLDAVNESLDRSDYQPYEVVEVKE